MGLSQGLSPGDAAIRGPLPPPLISGSLAPGSRPDSRHEGRDDGSSTKIQNPLSANPRVKMQSLLWPAALREIS
jgi:hypothetical protein